MTTPAAEPPLDAYLTLHAETRGFLLGRPQQPVPTPDGRSVLFLRAAPRDPVLSLFEYDVASGVTRELLTPARLLHGAAEHLSPEERARRERMRVATRGFTAFELSRDGRLLLVTLSGRLYRLRRDDGRVDELPTGAAPIVDPRLSPDGGKVAFVRERDLHVLDLERGVETRLTTTPDPRRSAGLAEFIAQEELSRFRGYWWSPDGTHVAYEHVDNGPVEELHIVDPQHPERAPEVNRYPRAGRPNARVSLWVVALPAPGAAVAPARPVPWDAEALPYLSQVTWTRGGPLTFVVRDRRQTRLQIRAWDEGTGTTRLLLEERDPAWLDVDRTVPRWLPGGAGFLWSSDVGGDHQLQLRSPDGTLVRALTPPGVQHRGLRHADERHAWFVASAEPSELHVWRAPLDGSGAAEQRSREPGQHDVDFGEGEATWVERTTTLTAMPRARVFTAGLKAQPAGELPSVAVEPPWVPSVELVRAGARALEAIVVHPRDRVAGRRYPVMVDVYGGPHHQSVTAALPGQLLRQWIADHGYVVVAIDGRGTPGRGRAFERALKEAAGHGSFGAVPLEDQVEGLRALAATRPEMDLSRVGIYGWSFGGYLAALAVLRRPDVFHVAVAGAPVVDWRDYDTAYTERYLGLPDENPAGYDESSLLTYAGGLCRPLLLVHGTTDDNVYFLHTLKLADALFRAGRDFELLPLQGFTHMVPDALVRRRLYGRILGTLERALQPGRP